MEYIKKEELIIGEVYTHKNGNICRCDQITNMYIIGKHLGNNRNEFRQPPKNPGNFLINRMRLATPEEKHWLNEAIRLDKFITFEEAMKTFIPEYVELINTGCRINCNIPAGKIYKCSKDVNKTYHYGFLLDNKHRIGFNENEFNQYLKPSTKEAYDAQFVVKEPEFVLPEKWCILRTGNNYNIINKWFQDNNLGKPYMNYGYIWKSNNNYTTYLTKPEHRTEITFEQFKKYVLKEEIVEEKVIEPLPQFKIIESIETITKVENNEGNQFFINDKIKVSLNMVQKIISFSYNEDKTEIFANFNQNLSISINDIEHYIEPKVEVEETLLDKAKRLYPVGTKFINPNGNKECVIKEKGNYFKGNNNNIYHSLKSDIYKYDEGLSGCIYMNNTWSKIIE